MEVYILNEHILNVSLRRNITVLWDSTVLYNTASVIQQQQPLVCNPLIFFLLTMPLIFKYIK